MITLNTNNSIVEQNFKGLLKPIFFGLSFFLLTLGSNAQSSWNLDPAHSSVEFEVPHLMISTVTGRFKSFEGSLTTGEKLNNARLSGRIDVSSIDTENKDRDSHLLGKDFFNYKEFPYIEFNTTSINEIGNGKYILYGELKINGIKRPIQLETIYKGEIAMSGRRRLALTADTAINRFDYGLRWNNLLETGTAMVGEEVKIKLNFEFKEITE